MDAISTYCVRVLYVLILEYGKYLYLAQVSKNHPSKLIITSQVLRYNYNYNYMYSKDDTHSTLLAINQSINKYDWLLQASVDALRVS